jgi:hypothetical protein
MVQYDTNNGPYPGTRPTFQVDTIHDSRPQNLSSLPNATGLLYCFEGGTGAIDDGTQTQTQKQFPLWSMMGFVLARTVTDVELNLSTDVQNPKPVSYDIYIVFRGSRSGKLRLWEAAYKEEGNPDWVTNWDLTQVIEDREISARGKVCRGFGTSIRTMLPTVVKAMEEIANQKQQPPRYIYVTAHSLGGALACHFTSAVLCGTKYGPKGTGGQMPDSLKKWPWESVKLVTYSSPVVGDNEFRDNFNKTVQSRRIWLDGDYVTQEQVNCLVGEPYRISVHHEQTLQEKKVGPQQISHHPYLIRRNLILSWRKAGDDKGKIPDVLPDIPAGTGTEHYEEPMKYFKHCADVLGHLVTIKAARPGAHPAIKELFALSELFPDFSEHFRLYLEIFREWEPDLSTTSNAKGNKLQWLMSNLGTLTGGTSKDTLESYWKTAKDIQSDEAFFNFIGLCLFLTKLSLSKGSHSTADLSTVMPFIGAEASGDYSDLLKNKI